MNYSSSLFFCLLIFCISFSRNLVAAFDFCARDSTGPLGSSYPKLESGNLTLDIVFVVDNTMSMRYHKVKIQESLPDLMREFLVKYNEPRFGLVTFNDEPSDCLPMILRTKDNYGTRLDLPLTDDFEKMESVMNQFETAYGDFIEPEDSLGGLLVAALNYKVGWRADVQSSHYRRVAVVITDADYRSPGDFRQQCIRRLLNNGDGDYDHNKEICPTPYQTRSALLAMEIVPVFITLPDPFGSNAHASYADLIDEWNIGGTAVFVRRFDNLADAIKESLKNSICPFVSFRQLQPMATWILLLMWFASGLIGLGFIILVVAYVKEKCLGKKKLAEENSDEENHDEEKGVEVICVEKKDVEKKDVEKKDVEKKDVEKKDVEKKDVEKKDVEKQDVEKKDVEKQDVEKKDVEKKDVEVKCAEKQSEPKPMSPICGVQVNGADKEVAVETADAFFQY